VIIRQSIQLLLTSEDLLPGSSKEKLYAHYITQASWAGARIIQGQWTPYAESLYDLLILIFSDRGKLADLEGLKQKSALPPQAWDDLLQYTIQVKSSSICRFQFQHICRSGFE